MRWMEEFSNPQFTQEFLAAMMGPIGVLVGFATLTGVAAIALVVRHGRHRSSL